MTPPVPLSREVMLHTLDEHPCPDRPPIEWLCPCGQTALLCCGTCGEPLLVFCCQWGRPPCIHAVWAAGW
ncbi:MAG TPA: hypothetical protein VKP64_15265 [Mycobacteriales bacterium]|nr:hypothetical protein [Mycobacteriales bacterium]